jgi:hypothetical protein
MTYNTAVAITGQTVRQSNILQEENTFDFSRIPPNVYRGTWKDNEVGFIVNYFYLYLKTEISVVGSVPCTVRVSDGNITVYVE